MTSRAFAIMLVTLGCLRSAGAQTAAAQAETMFREAKDLMAAGKIAEACAAFDASQKLDPTVSTTLNQANCREKNGQLATAWGLFLEAERATRAANDDTTRKLHQVATEHAAKLEKRVSKLTISVAADGRIDHLEVLRDRDVIDPATWNRALPLDGGTYKITARAPGLPTWTSTVTIGAEGDHKTVAVPNLRTSAPAPTPVTVTPPATSAPPPPKVAVIAPTPPQDEPTRETPEQPGGKRLALGLGIGSVVVLGAALGFELWGESIYDRAKIEPDPMKQDDLWSSANTRRYTAEGLAVAGVAGAGVAVWLYLHDRHATSSTARLVPTAGRDGVGIAGSF